MFQLSAIDPLSHPGWDELLLANSDATFFHTSMWARVLNGAYGFIPYYFTFIEEGKLSALIPVMETRNILGRRKGVSLPFTDTSNPIFGSDLDISTGYDPVFAFGAARGWKYLEVRGDDHLSDQTPYSSYYHHSLLLLDDEQAMFNSFKNGTKGNIKKAQKEGVRVTIDNSLESMRLFYELHCSTRKRHGRPPQPFSFFLQIQKHVLSGNHGFVALAWLNKRAIAGAMYFHFGDKAIYKYAASDMTHQQVRPNNLVMWEAIRWFLRNNVTVIQLGRTERSNEGLRYYKLGWGAHEEILSYYRYDLSKNEFLYRTYSERDAYAGILKKMPLPLLNAVGSVLYKYAA